MSRPADRAPATIPEKAPAPSFDERADHGAIARARELARVQEQPSQRPSTDLIQGGVRILVPPGAVAWLGMGSVTILDGVATTDVPIVDGRFQLHATPGAPVSVKTIRLDGLDARLAGDTQLQVGANTIDCRVEGPFLRLDVVDSETKCPIRRVEILTADMEEPSPSFPGLGPPPPMTPPATARTLLSDAPSPIWLGSEAVRGICWVGAPGYAWVPWVFPTECDFCPVSITLELRAACRLRVVVRGSTDEEGSRICLYDDEPLEPDRPVASEPLTRGEAVLSRLESGSYVARLETKGGLELAAERVFVGPHDDVTLTLQVDPRRLDKIPLSVRVHSASSHPRDRPASIHLTPASFSARRAASRAEVSLRKGSTDPYSAEITTWGPDALPQGTYIAEISPQHAVFEVVVDPLLPTPLEIELPATRDRDIAFHDADTGSLIDLRWIEWCQPVGSEKSKSSLKLRATLVDTPKNPVRLDCPDGQLLLNVCAEGYGTQEAVVEAEDVDGIVLLKKMSCVVVSLTGHSLDWDILSRVTVLRGEVVIPVQGWEMSWSMDSGHESKGSLYFFGSGNYEIQFPSLPSGGRLSPQPVLVVPGKGTELTVQVWRALQ